MQIRHRSLYLQLGQKDNMATVTKQKIFHFASYAL